MLFRKYCSRQMNKEKSLQKGSRRFFASLRGNYEKPVLGNPEYLTKREGGHVEEGNDWIETRGGVAYAWETGYVALIKDGLQWGNNYNGANIFGGHTPGFVQFRFNIEPVEWFRFNYFHGMLNSMLVDSTRSFWATGDSGSEYIEKYHRKFIAANMFSFRAFRGLWISGGNSIVYSDLGFHPVYLIPVFFYKSIDHTYNSGIDNMNSQMFLDISSRQIRHLHLYATLFIDELSVARLWTPGEYNFFSYKAGFRLDNFPIKNLALTGEFTYTYPLAFMHYVPTTTFETKGFNMGHYLKDNSREWHIALDYRPLRASNIRLFFTNAIRGPDYTALGVPRLGNPPLASVEWQSTTFGLKFSYQPVNDFYIHASFISSNISGNGDWSPGYFHGRQNTFSFGLTLGY